MSAPTEYEIGEAAGIIHAADDLIRNNCIECAAMVVATSGINVIRKPADCAAFSRKRKSLDRKTESMILRVSKAKGGAK